MLQHHGSARDFWHMLYTEVLDKGTLTAPRGRMTIELNDVQYSALPHQHFDPNPVRAASLDYIRREFLWFIMGDRFDTRMTKYAKLWEACVGQDGGINSNYGQYLFEKGRIYNALGHLVGDRSSRRAWVPIFQSWHQGPLKHDDYPCTTGVGFRIDNDQLVMKVHMRSQDLWHGAANDEAVCYLIQLVALAYLRGYHPDLVAGPIVHAVDSLHFYERHWELAGRAIASEEPDLVAHTAASKVASEGFSINDLLFLTGISSDKIGELVITPGFLLNWCLSIEGDYGYSDPYWKGVRGD